MQKHLSLLHFEGLQQNDSVLWASQAHLGVADQSPLSPGSEQQITPMS